MKPSTTFTTLIHEQVNRMRKGERHACDDLLRAAGERLEKLTRKMLRGYPGVQRWVEADDVLQNASMRLLRALETMQPASTRDFFNLAAVQIRRELIDLTRHFSGPLGLERHHDSVCPYTVAQPIDETNDNPFSLSAWSEFHEAVERLPDEEREVFNLIFYHGWQQQDVADICEVHVRTIRRRWSSALLYLLESVKNPPVD